MDFLVEANYDVNIIPLAPIQSALDKGIYNLSLTRSSITFFVDKVSIAKDYKLAINFGYKKLWSKNYKELLKKEFGKDYFQMTEHENNLEFSIDLTKFDIDYVKKERIHVLDLKIAIEIEGIEDLQNKSDLPKNQIIYLHKEEKM